MPLALALMLTLAETASGTLVVLNKAEATASLIDLASGRVVATLATGEGPHEAAVSPDGRLALAANYGTGRAPGATLTLIDVVRARVAKTIALGEYRRPHGVRWLPDGRHAVVTCEANKALLIVDVEAAAVAGAVTTGQELSHMVAVTPDGERAFVASIDSGSVTGVDLRARKTLGVVATGKGAEGIDVTPDGKQVWVTNREADTVSVLIRPARARDAPYPGLPIRITITPDGRKALQLRARRHRRVRRGEPQGAAADRHEAGSWREEGRSSRISARVLVPIGIVIRPDGSWPGSPPPTRTRAPTWTSSASRSPARSRPARNPTEWPTLR
jgi:DNA-binding beta-propeller fold protein YncE